jgi:hypothetical protein
MSRMFRSHTTLITVAIVYMWCMMVSCSRKALKELEADAIRAESRHRENYMTRQQLLSLFDPYATRFFRDIANRCIAMVGADRSCCSFPVKHNHSLGMVLELVVRRGWSFATMFFLEHFTWQRACSDARTVCDVAISLLFLSISIF